MSIPDLAANLSDFLQLGEGSLQKLRKTSDNPPRVSIYDVIQTVTGQTPSNCKHTWDRLVVAYPDVSTGRSNFKFAGRGQKETPVTDARGITEVLMLLPGRAAASFRKEAASVVVRYLGGDLSLIEEIAQNRLVQEQLPDSHPARLFGQAVESEVVKRLREELEVMELQGRIKRARVVSINDTLQIGFRALHDLGLTPSDRDLIYARDLLSTAMYGADTQTPEDRELCIRQLLLERGHRKPGLNVSVGKIAKRLFLNDNPGYIFHQKEIVCNGQCVMANIWRQSQLPYLEKAIAEAVV